MQCSGGNSEFVSGVGSVALMFRKAFLNSPTFEGGKG
jgi:hypothetical protein